MSRGVYGPSRLALERVPAPRLTVGREWFHSVADRKTAVAQIAAGFRDFMLELAHWHAARVNQQHARATAQWVANTVLPTVEEWNTFAARELGSWWVRAATSWETLVDWMDRLRQLRELARAHGIALESPEPAPLPKTLFEQGEAGGGNPIAPWFGIAKTVFAGALMVVGGYTVLSTVRSWTRHPAHPPE